MLRIFKFARDDAIALAALAAMLIWHCQEIIFAAQIPIFRDLPTYFYPIKLSVAEALKSWQLPLWDHRMAGGFPVLAGLQAAVFYPPSIAYLTLNFSSAIRFSFVFHQALAATGAYILFRSWNFPVFVSLLGSVLFSFAGPTASLSNLLNHFQSAVWLPLLVYFWEQMLRSPAWKHVSIFAVVSLCQILAGSPEIFVLSTGVLVIDTLRVAYETKLGGAARISVRILGAAFIVLGVGMVQWLPTAELITQSRREQAIHMSEALSWSLHPTSLIGLFIPVLEPDPSVTVGIRLLFARSVPFLLSHYLGIVGLFGLGCWFVTAPTNERRVVLTVIGVTIVMALGSFTPVYPLLYEWFPPFRVMRFPEKFWFVSFALLVFAIVQGFRRMDDQNSSGTWWKLAGAICAFWLIPYAAFRLAPQLWADLLAATSPSNSLAPDPKTIATILVLLEKQVAVSCGLFALFLLYQRGLLRYRLFGALLVVTTFFDLSSVSKPLHFLQDQSVLTNAPRILEKPPDDHGRIFYYPPGQNIHPSFMKVAGNPTYKKATEIPLNNLLPNAGILYGFEYFQDIDALARQSYTEFLMFINALPDWRRGKLLRALNVKFVIAFHALQIGELKLIRQFPEHYSALYEVDKPVPRAYIVPRAFYESEAKASFERIASDKFDPLREVVLDAPVPLDSRDSLTRDSFKGHSVIKLYENRRVVIDAELSAPGVLVLTDAYYPGWRVFVNGTEQTIRRANHLFRGIELPRGIHQVEFLYNPFSFKLGLVISLCSIIGLITVATVSSLTLRLKSRR